MLHHVHYDFVKWKGILASECRLFTDIDTAYIPTGHIFGSCGLRACLDFYADISTEALEKVKSMLVLDAVICNEDRYSGNFGVLMDSYYCRIFDAAPVFDNGVSLFNYAVDDEINNPDEYAKTRSNPCGVPYEVICSEVLGTLQRAQLKKLINLKFTRHSRYNLPDKRLKAVEKSINLRVNELRVLSHSEEPYIIARCGLPGGVPCSNVIPKQFMGSFYGELATPLLSGSGTGQKNSMKKQNSPLTAKILITWRVGT